MPEHKIHSPDSLKTIREALCVAQTAVNTYDQAADARRRDVLGRLIADIDRQRPLGPDGVHGDRHTPTCGCEDRGTAPDDPSNREPWAWRDGPTGVTPRLGGDVHYVGTVGPTLHEGVTPVCRAAKITAVPGEFEPGDPVSLMVFGTVDTGMSYEESRENQLGTKPGTWHWPWCCETGV